jgi:type IV pilus assembly protein PilV
MKNKHLAARSTQHGFSLLEVLVSVFILTFGLLAMAGLQAASLKVNFDARLQATGTRLADEIAEMMRSNKDVAIDLSAANNPYLVDLMPATAVPNPGCGLPASPGACMTPQAVAQRDVFEWVTRLRTELPDARIVICQDATPHEPATGLPQWACTNSGGVMVVKIGWTRSNTLVGATAADATAANQTNLGAFDKALRPAVTLSVIAGAGSI